MRLTSTTACRRLLPLARAQQIRACTSVPPARLVTIPGRNNNNLKLGLELSQSCYGNTLHTRVPRSLRSYSSSVQTATWQSLGMQAETLDKLNDRYPHVIEPTDAQKALLLALQWDDRRDIFLRDTMGRGKTFAMVLASLQLAMQGEAVLVLVPSIQLAEQVATLLDTLSPDRIEHTQNITVTTPKAAFKDSRLNQTAISTIMIDEPETMLAPLPPRHLPPPALRTHPFTRHPPPLATLLDRFLVHSEQAGRCRSVWVGAELNGLLKRMVRQRGWAGRDALELDFGGVATPRAKRDIETVLGVQPALSPTSRAVTHIGLVVEANDGEVVPFQMIGGNLGETLPTYRSGRPDIHQTLIDTLVSHELRSPPSTSYPTALVVPPEGYPLDLLAERINQTYTSVSPSTNVRNCSVFDPQTRSSDTPLTVVSRSSVPGLDIPTLRRIYLIDGLDLSGLSPAQRSRGGLKRRLGFYAILTGRLGRLGSVTADEGGEVISLILKGNGEEVGLGRIPALATIGS